MYKLDDFEAYMPKYCIFRKMSVDKWAWCFQHFCGGKCVDNFLTGTKIYYVVYSSLLGVSLQTLGDLEACVPNKSSSKMIKWLRINKKSKDLDF